MAARPQQVVLLVDDDSSVRLLAARTLREAGYSIVEAIDGHEAWLRFQRQPSGFAALLTDIVMPRMPGTELAARIHDVRPELPILLMTGFTPADLLERGLEATHGMLVTKPFAPYDLVVALRRALGQM